MSLTEIPRINGFVVLLMMDQHSHPPELTNEMKFEKEKEDKGEGGLKK